MTEGAVETSRSVSHRVPARTNVGIAVACLGVTLEDELRGREA
jgi:hypothetical protein